MPGRPVEIRVRVEEGGLVFVSAPKGLQSMRIVTSRDRMPGAVGHRVRELVEEVLENRETLVALADGAGKPQRGFLAAVAGAIRGLPAAAVTLVRGLTRS